LLSQHAGRRAASIADDCSQHDRAVDLAPPALTGGGRGILDDAQELGRGDRSRAVARREAFVDPGEIVRHISIKPIQVDPACLQHR
jgi:hypothetical protein